MLTLRNAANMAATVHHADAITEVQADELLPHFCPALHRFRSTPALERGQGGLSGLRLSLGAELMLGLLILALVGAMGMLAPPASL